MTFDVTPACDWLAFRHDYPAGYEADGFGGKVMKISAEGEIDWESVSWEAIRCPSSDTSIRVKSDGRHVWGTGNIGRFQRSDNLQGLTVMQCLDRWAEVLRHIVDLHGFGTRWRKDTVAEWGTHIRRIDLCANFWTDDYPSLMQAMSIRPIGQRIPVMGKYGPCWGYDARRSNWVKAKLYDKSAELAKRRKVSEGETTARFEIQLGSEYLKRNGLDRPDKWKGDDMAKIIYGRFAEQVFKDSISVQNWGDLPPKLQHWATCWREGRDIRADMSRTSYYRIKGQLKEYGIDISVPCNVLALSPRVKSVTVMPLENLLHKVG